MTASGKCSRECSQCWPKVSGICKWIHDLHIKWHFDNSFSGIPDLGIEHFEPLILQSVQVSRGSGSLTLAGGFKNLIVKGPSNTTVSRARWAFIWNTTMISHIHMRFYSNHAVWIWRKNCWALIWWFQNFALMPHTIWKETFYCCRLLEAVMSQWRWRTSKVRCTQKSAFERNRRFVMNWLYITKCMVHWQWLTCLFFLFTGCDSYWRNESNIFGWSNAYPSRESI